MQTLVSRQYARGNVCVHHLIVLLAETSLSCFFVLGANFRPLLMLLKKMITENGFSDHQLSNRNFPSTRSYLTAYQNKKGQYKSTVIVFTDY